MRYIKKPNWEWIPPFYWIVLTIIFIFGLTVLCIIGIPLSIISIGIFNFRQVAEDYCNYFYSRMYLK